MASARPTPATISPTCSIASSTSLVINRLDSNSSQTVRFLDNPEVRDVITRLIRDQVYDRIQEQSKERASPYAATGAILPAACRTCTL